MGKTGDTWRWVETIRKTGETDQDSNCNCVQSWYSLSLVKHGLCGHPQEFLDYAVGAMSRKLLCKCRQMSVCTLKLFFNMC
jgi:hypothetical protein